MRTSSPPLPVREFSVASFRPTACVLPTESSSSPPGPFYSLPLQSMQSVQSAQSSPLSESFSMTYKPQWIPSVSPPLTSPYRDAVHAQFLQVYIPAASTKMQPSRQIFPRTNLQNIKEIFVSMADGIVQSGQSPMFDNSYLAMQLVFIGRERGDMGLINHATTLYQDTLSLLQKSISGLNEHNIVERWFSTTLTVCTCSWLEVLGLPLKESSASALVHSDIRHTVGSGSLLRRLGTERGKFVPYFLEGVIVYRAALIFPCLANRHPSFLASEPWLYRTLKAECGDTLPNPMQVLLDDAYQIPVLMKEFDDAIAEFLVQSDYYTTFGRVKSCLVTLESVDNAIKAWAVENTANGEWTSSRWPGAKGSTNTYYSYFDYNEGLAWVYYCTIRLYTIDFHTQVQRWLAENATSPLEQFAAGLNDTAVAPDYSAEDEALARQKLSLATAILQSVEFHFDPAHGNTAPSMALAPFRVATQALVDAMRWPALDSTPHRQRLEWCRRVVQRYVARGYPYWMWL
ncbi:hypothetical protein FH972_023229 [Carpinus fangiana]|uniref:Uncharacterized protein n=1 Tax=Carpinus fangiana TaxID=176857 RepID=A0A5N6KV23_9ROSI|nr:hypothetical protein FH972_023229 [Carpinus fangiana]